MKSKFTLIKINFLLLAVLALFTISANSQNIVQNGDFEAGSGTGAWVENSLNWGTPLCDPTGCGTNASAAPRSGSWWAWFGGTSQFEEASISQTIMIPANYDTLTFYLWMGLCDSLSLSDYLEVIIDTTQIFYIDASNIRCGEPTYIQSVIDISAFADGNSHVLTFHSIQNSPTGEVSNFNVDDISIVENTTGGTPSATSYPECGSAIVAALNVAIPDDDSTGVTSVIPVSGISGSNLGTDVFLTKVRVKVTHTWVGDLVLRVTAPNGASAILQDRPGVPATSTVGCGENDMNYSVISGTGKSNEDECNLLPPAITGVYSAVDGSNLATLNLGGGDPNGNWFVYIADLEGIDTGTLDTIEFYFASANQVFMYSVSGTTVDFQSGLIIGITRSWDFGDGQTGTGANPTHVYAGMGSYTVTMTTESATDTCSSSQQVDLNIILSANTVNPNDVVFEAYPNPVNSILKIKLQNSGYTHAVAELYNNLGQLIYSKNIFTRTNLLTEVIDMSSFSNGIYSLRISGSKESFVKVIVKE